MFKNVASQKLIVFAFDATTNLPKSGDAANITAYVGKDFGAATVLGDTSATEIDATNAKGYYLFDLTATETNADTLHFTAKSSTANIVVIGVPATVYTNPANFTATSIDSNGRVDVIKINGTSQTARDIGASVLLSAGTGTGQLDFTSGVVKGNVVQIDGSATNGNNATLNLKSLNINASGTGVNGLTITGGTNVAGVVFAGAGSGAALQLAPGATGIGLDARGGATSGAAVNLTTFGGDAISIAPVAGHGISITANGTSKHGITVTGGTAGTSDGIKAVAGSGGVPIRGDITGNITGNLSGSAGSVTGAVGSVTGSVTVGTNNDKAGYSLTQSFPTNFSSLAITGGGAVTAGTVSDKTGYSLTQAFPSNFSVLSISASTGLVDITQTAADKAWSTATRTITGGTIGTYTGNTVQTGDAYARLGAPAGASIAADIAALPAAVWAYVVENSKTALHYIRVIKASVVGKLSGAATNTITCRDDADSKARVTATVDSDGNRSAVTIDGT